MNQENNTTDNREVKTVYMAPAEWCHPQMEDDEIDLISLVAVLWRRKKIIVGFTICLAALAAVVVMFMLTPQYRVSAMISPGIIGFTPKTPAMTSPIISGLTQEGEPIHASSPSDLKEWLDSGAYVDEMISRMSEDAAAQGLIPEPGSLETNVQGKGGKILRVNLFTPEPESGEKALESILKILTSSQENVYVNAKKKLQKAMADINKQWEDWDIQQTRHSFAVEKIEKEIGLLKKDLESIHENIEAQKKIIEKQDVQRQINDVRANTIQIRELRDDIADTRDNMLMFLMLSNIIQQNIDYAIRLEERQDKLRAVIFDKKQIYRAKQVEVEKKLLELKDIKENQTRELENEKEVIARQMELLKFQYDQLTPLEIVQKPTSSIGPEKPDKKKIVALATVMGLFMGIMLAFMMEFYIKFKHRLNET